MSAFGRAAADAATADAATADAGTADASTAIAVVDGQTRWTRHERNRRADAIAEGLFRAGVAPGARVALLAVPSADAIAALHAIARGGGAVVPLGAGLAPTELAIAVEVTNPRLVVHGSGLGAVAAALGRPAFALEELMAGAPGPPRFVAPPLDPASPAAIILTSGTTGRPKGVVLSGTALNASADAWLAALPPATGWLLALGLNHVAGLGIVWRAARSGVPLVVLPRPDPRAIAAALATDPAPSHVSLVPTTLARILDAADGPPPSTLRAVLLGGGPIPPELVTRAVAAGWPVVPTYGLSEAGSGVTALSTQEAALHPDSAGRPLPGVEVRIAEPDTDGVGEILVASPARFTGYLGDPVATDAAFTDGHWLRTGDLGRLDGDGRLRVVDRRTDRIVRGGENVSPAEVEAVLRDHPDIADAAVVARRDATFGHVPVAAIVLRDGHVDPGDEDLARFCRARLAAFKVPAAFIRLDALPRTGSGKPRRAELRASLEDRAGDASPSEQDHHLARPGDVSLAWRNVGSGPIHLLLLHGTLSTGAQLGRLAREFVETGAFTVHAVDRRGSGRSRLSRPVPLDVAVHVADLAAILDAESCPAAVLVGVSYGGVVALEFAARELDRALAVIAYEPPYGPVADAETRRAFEAVAAATARAHRTGGVAAAAEAFMRGVAGDRAWDRLPERTRSLLADEGDSAYVDAGLGGLDPGGLHRVRVPTLIVTGDASDPFYAPIAEALVEFIPGARRQVLPGMTHAAPITDPAPIAEAVLSALVAAGVMPPASTRSAVRKSRA